VIKPICGGKGLAQPWGIAWDPTHTWLYIGELKNARIVRMKPDGSTCQVVVTQADFPSGDRFLGSNLIQFDSAGRVSDNSRHIYASPCCFDPQPRVSGAYRGWLGATGGAPPRRRFRAR
jgi:hypothetical protein